MVIIILNINNNSKENLLYKINKQRLMNEIDKFEFWKNIEIIRPIIELESTLKKIYKIDFPVKKIFSIDDNFLDNLNTELEFNNNSEILLPYFNGTEFWVKATLLNKRLFLSYMYDNKIINNITIISIYNSIYNNIYDIEIGENIKTYELRLYKIDNK